MPEFKGLKMSPVVFVVITIVLAVASVVGSMLLYRSRQAVPTGTSQFVPTKSEAATTTTISDNFGGASIDASKWSQEVAGNNSGSAGVSSGQLNIIIPTGTGIATNALRYVGQINGGFLC